MPTYPDRIQADADGPALFIHDRAPAETDGQTGDLWINAATSTFYGPKAAGSWPAFVSAGFQPLDADLTAIAALATTSYGRAFLTLADAAAGRTALSAPSAAELTAAIATVEPYKWVPAAAMGLTGGAALLNVAGADANNRVDAYLMDPASSETVATTVLIPQGWTTAHVDVYWAAVSGTGDAVWRSDRYAISSGASLSGETEGALVTGTASAATTVVVTRTLTSLAVTAGSVLRLETCRIGGDAADTLAADAAFIGLLLTRAS